MSDKDHREKLVDGNVDIFYPAGIFQKLYLLNKTIQVKTSNLVDSKNCCFFP